ncbi:substrate-binding periplasmic protein [Neptuniibacter halophilus]|uniref:substrate-binding periplasmic protein n=1 Tax=Neptuniibacter halophilus TaxID=651666 RepID=UPI0025725DF7|nr:transporter substrate-binding domain-containing protein [Neptuniibacter halophilus]
MPLSKPTSRSRYGLRSVICAAALVLISPMVQADATVRALVQNSQPKYFLENANLGGLCGEIYQRLKSRLAQRQVELKIDTQYLPIKRILREVEMGPAGIYCGAGRNAEREKRFIYSAIPVYSVSNVVLAHQDEAYLPSSIAQLAKDGISVGALFGTSSAAYLKSHQGTEVFDKIYSLDEALRLVAKRKIRLFYYHDLGLNYLVKHSDYSLKVLPTRFRTTPQWVVYSPAMSPELRQILDQELQAMLNSGELAAINRNYLD